MINSQIMLHIYSEISFEDMDFELIFLFMTNIYLHEII